MTLAFSAWPGWFPWEVAAKKGLFAANGVDVELKYFDNYLDSLTALSTGNVTANSQTLNDTLISISAAGASKQTIVLVNDNSTGNDQIIARPGITAIADLKGKTIAVEQGTVDHFLLLLALLKAGLTGRGRHHQGAARPPTPRPRSRPGRWTRSARSRRSPRPRWSGPAARRWPPRRTSPARSPTTWSSQASFVAEHPDAVQAVVKTWFDTLAWIAANKDEAIAIMAEKAGVSVDDYKSYDAGTTIFSRAQNLAAFTPGTTAANLDYQAKQISQFLVATGLAPQPSRLWTACSSPSSSRRSS